MHNHVRVCLSILIWFSVAQGCSGDSTDGDGDADVDGDVDGDADGDVERRAPGSACDCDNDCREVGGHGGVCVHGICMTRAIETCAETGSTEGCPVGFRCYFLEEMSVFICSPDCGGIDCYGVCNGDGMCLFTPETSCDPLCGALCRREITECEENSDRDEDGSDSLECGGDDCDDDDRNRYPGNVEVCDEDGRDEDCDPSTLGHDRDGDGYVSAECCNDQPDGPRQCGADCNDRSGAINPEALEICNRHDENCDGEIDEDLPIVSYYPDCDGDGFGASGSADFTDCAAPITPPECGGVAPLATWADNDDDCDDLHPDVNPAAREVCDTRDTDCNGLVDDAATGCECTTGTERDCSVDRGECTRGTQRCIDGVWGACGGTLPTDEICDGLDNDCDGDSDEGLRVTCYTDWDGDTYGVGPSASRCRQTGGHGGCGAGWAGRRGDCDDRRDDVRPDFGSERCDEHDHNCNGNPVDGYDCVPSSARDCTVCGGHPGRQSCNSSSCRWQSCRNQNFVDSYNGSDARMAHECTGSTCSDRASQWCMLSPGGSACGIQAGPAPYREIPAGSYWVDFNVEAALPTEIEFFVTQGGETRAIISHRTTIAGSHSERLRFTIYGCSTIEFKMIHWSGVFLSRIRVVSTELVRLGDP